MSTPPRKPRRPPRGQADGPPFVGALLRLSWQRVRARLNAAIRAAGFDDLQEAHFTIFSYPVPDGVRPSELARHIGASRQAANHLIAQMETLGYLERRAPAGSRRRLVYLTRRGHRVVEVTFACLRAIQTEWAQEAGAARFADFMALLRRFARADGQDEPPRR